MKKRAIIAIAILFFVSIATIFIYITTTINVKHNYNLPSNKPQTITQYLQDKNISTNIIDQLALSYLKPAKGWVYINKTKLPRYRFWIELSSQNNRYKIATIIPGETTYFVLKDLANKLDYNLTKLKTAYKTYQQYKEGNILANTYHIPSYYSETKAIKYLIDKSIKKYKKIAQTNHIKFKDLKKYIIVASILEKESANKEEMPLIASVIYNRLNKKMRLQVDGSLNYGEFSHTKVTPLQIKNDKTTYNTYKHKGLPKEPVCNISLTSLKSAIHPAQTDFLYFVKKDKKSHRFSKTFKKHRENIKLIEEF